MMVTMMIDNTGDDGDDDDNNNNVYVVYLNFVFKDCFTPPIFQCKAAMMTE